VDALLTVVPEVCDGEYGQGPDSVNTAAAKAIASARAL
jgi:hypothetical protein